MKTKFYKSIWGMEDVPTVDEKLRQISMAGYEGVEFAGDPGCSPDEWKAMLVKHNLSCIFMIFPGEADEIEEQLQFAADHGAPFANSHSGRDKWSFAEGCAYFRRALDAEQKVGIPIAHETHRHRLFYSPWSTAAYLREFPELRITADFSHWCVVCESLLDDFEDELELAISRAIHIHGRVGHQESAQVSHPAAPEWREHLERHEKWWDQIRETRAQSDTDLFTFTPEFGPASSGYLPSLPFTKQPVADLWEICDWMAERERKRWGLK